MVCLWHTDGDIIILYSSLSFPQVGMSLPDLQARGQVTNELNYDILRFLFPPLYSVLQHAEW